MLKKLIKEAKEAFGYCLLYGPIAVPLLIIGYQQKIFWACVDKLSKR